MFTFSFFAMLMVGFFFFASYSILLVKVSEAYRACGRLLCMFSHRQVL